MQYLIRKFIFFTIIITLCSGAYSQEESYKLKNSIGINFVINPEYITLDVDRGVIIDYKRNIYSFLYFGGSARFFNNNYAGLIPSLSMEIPLNNKIIIPVSIGGGVDFLDLNLTDTSLFGEIRVGLGYQYNQFWLYYFEGIYNHQLSPLRKNQILIKLGVKYNF